MYHIIYAYSIILGNPNHERKQKLVLSLSALKWKKICNEGDRLLISQDRKVIIGNGDTCLKSNFLDF